MNKGRMKYDPSLKLQILYEYNKGASAKELYIKYGVKERTIYDWNRKAKNGSMINKTKDQISNMEKSAMKSSESGYDCLNDKINRLNNKVNTLVDNLEKALKEIKKS